MILREFHGLLWEIHTPSCYRLAGRSFWVERGKRRWRCRAEGRKRVVKFDSRDEAMEHVAAALERYGDSAA